MFGRARLTNQLAAHAAVVAPVEKSKASVAKLAAVGRVVGLPGWLARQELLNKATRCQTDWLVLSGPGGPGGLTNLTSSSSWTSFVVDQHWLGHFLVKAVNLFYLILVVVISLVSMVGMVGMVGLVGLVSLVNHVVVKD